MTIIHRLFAWGLAAAIAFATLGPAEQRPHSTLGQNGEHALAFVLLGLAFGLAYTRNRLHTAAFVVAPGVSRAAILAALRERIDPAFLPRPMILVDALPRDALGKLPRENLTELASRTIGDDAASTT